ncbi:MAG: serine/threonine protein kinase [Planctomyces sp.]|nr:serine/threonine protein kinase [Planctomyces sp.]
MAAGRSFLESLERSRILSPTRLQRVRAAAARWPELPDSGIARKLLSAGVVSRYQAEELLRGNFRRLRVGDYVLQDIVGFGGMGNVYRARDAEEHRIVALKVLSSRFQHDRGMQARFRLEAEAGLQLEHANLVRTLTFGETQELYGDVNFMVMEFFEGIALHELVSVYGLVKYDSVCDIACQAAAGLGQMHQQDLIHRDVKPDNLLVGHSGHAKLLDFGLALADKRAFDDEFSLAMIFGHDGLGTLDYMAPEQSYDSMTVDARADIYGLGCTLYAVLTGRRPFPYPSRSQVLAAHRTEAPPSVLSRAPHVPVALAEVVQRMMAKDPGARYESMAAVEEVLRPFSKRRPIPFDFPAILNRRRDEAQARLARQGRSLTQMVQRQSTTSTRGSHASLQNTGMAQETDLQSDVSPGVHPPEEMRD